MGTTTVICATFSSVAVRLVPTSEFSSALLNVRWLDGSLSSITDITRLKYSSPLSQRSMVANVLWFGCRLCGNYSCQRRTILWPLQFARPHIRCMSTSSLKRMTIYIVVFMITQYKKLEFRVTYCSSSCTDCHYTQAAHPTNTIQPLKLECNQRHW